jgi:hypothetical protein
VIHFTAFNPQRHLLVRDSLSLCPLLGAEPGTLYFAQLLLGWHLRKVLRILFSLIATMLKPLQRYGTVIGSALMKVSSLKLEDVLD